MKNLIKTPMYVGNAIDVRVQELEKVRDEISIWMSNAPKGSIQIFPEFGKIIYVFCDESGKRRRINGPLSDYSVYFKKWYYKKIHIILKRGIPKIKSIRKNYLDLRVKIQNEYTNLDDAVKKLINPIDMSNEDVAKKWYAIPFVPSNIPIETDFYTVSGIHVRSKSEVEVGNIIAFNGFYCKYECPVKISENNFYYPDFTIWDPVMRKEIYWEHFGKMDDADYANRTAIKLKNYLKIKKFLGDDLIFTMETLEYPLGTTEIQYVIEHHLLHKDSELG